MIVIPIAVVAKLIAALVVALLASTMTFVFILMLSFGDDEAIPLAWWAGVITGVIAFLTSSGIIVFV